MKTLTNFEDPYFNLFSKRLLRHSGSRLWLWNVIPNSPLQNYLNFPPSYPAYGTFYIIIKRITLLLFTTAVDFLNAILIIGAHTKSTDLIIWAFQTKYSSHDIVPLMHVLYRSPIIMRAVSDSLYHQYAESTTFNKNNSHNLFYNFPRL